MYHGTPRLLPEIIVIQDAQTKPKCNFFAWVMLHKKILMDDQVSRGWSHKTLCKYVCN